MTANLAQSGIIEAVLELLSLTEAAQVNTATELATGEEYVDLEEPRRGVQRFRESRAARGRVLPRSAVNAPTWQKIVALIGESPADVAAPLSD